MSTASSFVTLIQALQAMPNQVPLQKALAEIGLSIQTLVWEDAGRYKNSSVGPQISDLTIQIQDRTSSTTHFHAMPVIRSPSFEDKTGEWDPRDVELWVGNHEGSPLQKVSLHEFLNHPKEFLSFSQKWNSSKPFLIAPERDDRVLVSAQVCLVPVEPGKITYFNPVLFNYQSSPGAPAVLTILSSPLGTSVTLIENQNSSGSDSFAGNTNWGQKLFHNQSGKKSSLTASRVSDLSKHTSAQNPTVKINPDAKEEINKVLIIQVPLKYKPKKRLQPDVMTFSLGAPSTESSEVAEPRGVEKALISYGEVEGPFHELSGVKFERDPKFPVRVTVQYYMITQTDQLSPESIKRIADNVNAVYESLEKVSSLVTSTDQARVTEYWGAKVQPSQWWKDFWTEYELDFKEDRSGAQKRLEKILGKKYFTQKVTELYLRKVLKETSVLPKKEIPNP
jgi:hypothetical protein